VARVARAGARSLPRTLRATRYAAAAAWNYLTLELAMEKNNQRRRRRRLPLFKRMPELLDAQHGATFAGPVFTDDLLVRQADGTERAVRRRFRSLTSRDIEILGLLLEFRHLERDHVVALLRGDRPRSKSDGAGRQIDGRLSGLFHHGLVQRYPRAARMRPDLPENRTPAAPIYGLDTEGWKHLAYARQRGWWRGGEDELTKWRKDHTRRGATFVLHTLMRSHFRVVLTLGVRGADVEIDAWDESVGGRIRVMLDPASGTAEDLPVFPDAYFALEGPRGRRNLFLEVDRETERMDRIRKKLLGYWFYFAEERGEHAYVRTYPNPERVNVLFVVKTPERLGNMLDLMERLQKPSNPRFGGRGVFWFCLEEDYNLANPASILGPIWRSVTRPGERLSLLEGM